jgi:uncharacterized phage infection (PIP) family protein YhgE
MIPFRFRRKLIASLAGGLFVLGLALVGAAFAPATPAFAQEATPTPRPGQAERDERLKNWYQREQNWLNAQAQHLGHLNEHAARAQEWIDELKGKGEDTSALEAALATFNGQIAAAQSAHDTAAGLLAAHAGFDGAGNVTDPDQARQTLVEARESLNSAHQTIVQARRDFLQAARDFRKTHHLERGLTRLREWLDTQAANLQRANDGGAKVQEWIDKLKAEGKDTSALEAALSTFHTQMASAQAAHDAAASTLANPAGFDSNGKVVDEALAKQTLDSARASLKQAHDLLVQAVRDLHQAVKDYRAANK